MYTPKSKIYYINSVNCLIENFQCHMSDCKDDVSHLLVKSNYNINTNHIELTSIKKSDILLNVIFSCDNHLMANQSAIFYMGEYLNNHYIKKMHTNDWVHFKDYYYWIEPNDLKLNEGEILFVLDSTNYLKILQENSNLLFNKLNNYFYFGGSLYKSGFCTVCNNCEKYTALGCRDYINRELVNTLGLKLCECGCPQKVHYIDNEWDSYFKDNIFQDLKWPINLYNERGPRVKVNRYS